MAEFINSLRIKGRSDNTLINYGVDLRQFYDYLKGQGISELSELDDRSVRIFMSNIIGLGNSRTSAARKLSAIRGYLKWLREHDLISPDIAINIKTPRLPQSLPKALSYEETNRLLIDGVKGSRHYERDALILEILYASGLRVSELISLNWENVDLENRTFRVTGKGEKERIVPFGQRAAKMLTDWKDINYKGEGYPVFKSGDKTADRLTVRTVHRIVTRAAKKVGLYGVSPHTLRHCFATHMLERGAPLRVVQELLGHESIATTQKYLSITTEQMKSSYLKAYPRADTSIDS